MDITHQICTRMREVGLSVNQISDELQIDPATYYRKLQSGGMKFTLAQLQRLTELLGLSAEEAGQLFFHH